MLDLSPSEIVAAVIAWGIIVYTLYDYFNDRNFRPRH